MGTIVGYTATRMKAIEDASIVAGAVILNNLQLTRHDGTTLDAGNVRGPQGIQGIAGDSAPIGGVIIYAGSIAPPNWVFANGSSLLRAGQFAPLYSVIGSVYGSVDGTHFNLPNLQGRVPIGPGISTAPGATSHALGSTGGEEKHTMTSAELVSHSHRMSQSYIDPGTVYGDSSNWTKSDGNGLSGGPIDTQPTGGSAPFNVLPPYLTVTFIIRYV